MEWVMLFTLFQTQEQKYLKGFVEKLAIEKKSYKKNLNYIH